MSNKTVNKRLEVNKKYMDAFQENNSKLCIARVDFGYKKDDNSNVDITPVKNNSKDRAFVRGIMPKVKSKAGRPRKETGL
jgi:hypothetical protein